MIMTLSVLALLLAVSVPSFLSFQKTALIENSAINLLSLFEMAQSEALKQNNEIHVHYIPSTSSTDGCFALSLEPQVNQNKCDDDTGMPTFILKHNTELTVLAPNDTAPRKLFYFSSITGLPSVNITIKFSTDDEIEKISGVLVRKYAGLRGCSNTVIAGWEGC